VTDDIIFTREARAARIRLNRPKAIHALTHDMCGAMLAKLAEWRSDPEIEIILLDHAEGRGFCAGGDVRAIAESGAGDGSAARAFFHEEYRLNHLLFTYAKPVVAFTDGIVMGGGVGISQPAKYRVATENTRFAMPETALGLFPDVGGGWYLSRLEGRAGQFLALTGARLDGAECLYLGLATHYIPSEALEDVKTRILDQPDRVEGILRSASVTPPPAKIAENQVLLNKLFASDTLEDILEALESDPSPWAARERDTIGTKSPLSLKVSLRLLKEGKRMNDFADEMRMEYAVGTHVVQRHDFAEGVRAVLVDKDNAPRWQPATPGEISDHLIDQIFAPLPQAEQWTPLP